MIEQYVRERVEIVGDCWLWTASKNGHGYPVMQLARKKLRPARLLMNCPEGKFVTATCGHKDCLSPKHLKVVTKSQYMKGRKQSAGWVARVKVGRLKSRKLTPEAARQIRARRGEPRAAVAKDFGISLSAVSYIWNGHWWAEPSPWAI